MGACAPPMYRTGESLFKSMGAWEPNRCTDREIESFFKGMGAWAPTTFSKGGCGKSLFENRGSLSTQDVRTVSFLMMYSEG